MEVIEVVQLEEEGELLLPDEVGYVVEHDPLLLHRVTGVPVGHPEAAQLELFGGEQVHGYLERAFGHASVGDHRPSTRETASEVRARLAAHTVEGELDGRKIGEDLLEGEGVEVVVGDVHVAAETGEQLVDLHRLRTIAPNHIDGPNASLPRHLDDREADHAVRAVLNDDVSFLESGEVMEEPVGGAGVDSDGGRVGNGYIVGHLYELRGVVDEFLPPNAQSRLVGDDPVAHTQSSGSVHSLAQLLDNAHALVASEAGKGGLNAVCALDHVQIGGINGRG